MRFAATRQLIVALLVLAVRSQQLYTVHYRTVVANAVPKGIGARDAALLVEPMAVRFAGALRATSWKPLSTRLQMDGRHRTDEFFVTAPIGRLQTVAFRAGGAVHGSGWNATFDPLRDVSVDVGDSVKMKFTRHTTDGNVWIYHHANVHTRVGGDKEDKLVQTISFVAAAGSLLLALLVSLCVQLRGGGRSDRVKVGVEFDLAERAPITPGYAAQAPVLPSMGGLGAVSEGTGAGAGAAAGAGGGIAGSRGYTGYNAAPTTSPRAALSGTVLPPIKVPAVPMPAVGGSSTGDAGFNVPTNTAQTASAAAHGGVGAAGYGGDMGGGYGGIGGGYGGGAHSSGGFDTFDEEEPL